MAMSLRSFSRLFHGETRSTPAEFAERARADAARYKLEQTLLPVETVAKECGFGNAERMRRTFQRLFDTESSGLPGAVSVDVRSPDTGGTRTPILIGAARGNPGLREKIREKRHANSPLDHGA